jgi:hypothetical protein
MFMVERQSQDKALKRMACGFTCMPQNTGKGLLSNWIGLGIAHAM